jgi:hypothetical protein
MPAELHGRITFDTSELTRAQSHARAFSDNLKSIFRRDPSHRAESAISGFIASLSSGDVSGAISGITGKLTGLGLAAGAGVGAAAIAIAKMASAMHEALNADRELEAQMSKPINVAAGPAALTKEIEDEKKALDSLVDKTASTWYKIGEILSHGAMFTTSSESQVDKDKKEAAVDIVERSATELASARNLFEIKKKSLETNSQEAAIDKIRAETAEKIAAIDSADVEYRRKISQPEYRKQLDDETFKQLTAGSIGNRLGQEKLATDEGKLDESQEAKKSFLKNQEIESEKKLTQLSELGLAPEKEKILATQENIKLTQVKIAAEKDATKQAELQVQLEKEKAQLQQQAKEYITKELNKIQLPLKELSGIPQPYGGPTGTPNTGLPQAGGDGADAEHTFSQKALQAGRKARQAEEEEQKSHDLMYYKNDFAGSERHHQKAESIKNEIDPLRESEKDQSAMFETALDKSQALKEANQSLSEILKAVSMRQSFL